MFDAEKCPIRIGDKVEFLNADTLVGNPPGNVVLEFAERTSSCPNCRARETAVFGYGKKGLSYAVCGCSLRVIS